MARRIDRAMMGGFPILTRPSAPGLVRLQWGDRSMLATVALAASQSPIGVALGAIGGHGLATLMAVLGGSIISPHISERMMSLIGGSLFLLFAATTAVGLF